MFQMIILLYLIVILGWALLILVIKCRKAREKRIALAQQEGEKIDFLLKLANEKFSCSSKSKRSPCDTNWKHVLRRSDDSHSQSFIFNRALSSSLALPARLSLEKFILELELERKFSHEPYFRPR